MHYLVLEHVRFNWSFSPAGCITTVHLVQAQFQHFVPSIPLLRSRKLFTQILNLRHIRHLLQRRLWVCRVLVRASAKPSLFSNARSDQELHARSMADLVCRLGGADSSPEQWRSAGWGRPAFDPGDATLCRNPNRLHYWCCLGTCACLQCMASLLHIHQSHGSLGGTVYSDWERWSPKSAS